MKLTAKKLILGLMVADPDQAMPVQSIIRACALFRITENNVRVTLVRLSAEGLIESRGRGAYGVGPQARNTALEVARWHNAEQRLRDWSGAYIAVHTGMMGRSDRKALNQRERALDMLGLRELERGLHIRPDNLSGGVAEVRHRLHDLGVPDDATVFLASAFEARKDDAIRALWDGDALNRRYREQTQRLNQWLARHDELERDVAARESYLAGAEAIRMLVFDPWLPEPLVDGQARHAFVQATEAMDAAGKAIWQDVLDMAPAHPLTGTASAFNTPRKR